MQYIESGAFFMNTMKQTVKNFKEDWLISRKVHHFHTIEKAIFLAFIFAALISFSGFAAACENIPARVLRLHVLANSDSSADQALKLQVRDRILVESKDLLGNVKNRKDAEKIIKNNLDVLQKTAQDEIYRRGYQYPVSVKLENTYFTTREYRTVTLPAGEYQALRVLIGSAQGRNWWCVIFPPMCLPAAEEQEELDDVLNEKQLMIVEGKNRYQIKFKTLELYEQAKAWLEQPSKNKEEKKQETLREKNSLTREKTKKSQEKEAERVLKAEK